MSTPNAGKVLNLNIISAVKVVEISLTLDGTRASSDRMILKIRQNLGSKHSILLDIYLAVLAYPDAKVRTKLWRCFDDSLRVKYCICRYQLAIDIDACGSMDYKCT